MQDCLIKLNDEFVMPENIRALTADEWEVIIVYISDLLLKHDSISAKINTKEIEKLMESKYSQLVAEKDKQISSHLADLAELRINQKAEIIKTRIEAEENFKMTYLDAKDAIIQNLKDQIIELSQQISSVNGPLQEEISHLKESHDKQLRKLRNQLEEQYRLSMKTSIQEVSESKDSIIQTLKTQLGETAQLQKQVDSYREQINQIQLDTLRTIANEREQLYREHKAELEELRTELQVQQRNQIEELLHQTSDSISRTLEPIRVYYGGTNQEKGDGGEIAIRQVLERSAYYDSAIIEDVSGQAAQGDIYLKLGHMSCLIEVKNKVTLTKDDITKFERDIHSAYKKINCALFVSTRTKQIPGGSRSIMQLTYINGIPVIYVYAPPPSNEIHYALACIERLIQKDETATKANEELVKHFIDYHNDALANQKYFDKKLKDCQREIKEITKHLEKYNTLCDQLSPAYARLCGNEESTDEESSDLEESAEETQPVEELNEDTKMQQLSDCYVRLSLANQTPSIQLLAKSFSVAPRVIESIGFKKIAAYARQSYTDLCINTDRANKVIDFFNTNNRYPNRKELVSLKIIPDHVLRNLAKVTKQIKVAEYIASYVEQLAMQE